MMTGVLFAAFLALTYSAVALAVPREAVAAGVVRATPNWTFDNCGDTNNLITVNSASISPDQPKAGRSVTISVDFDVTTTIVEGAKLDFTIKPGMIQKSYDLCEFAASAFDPPLRCPLENGHYDIKYTTTLPDDIPDKTYAVHFQGYSAGVAHALFCLEFKVKFPPS